MYTAEINHKLSKDGKICNIKIINNNNQNQLLIECSILSNKYSSIIDFKNKEDISSDEAIDIFKYFFRGRIYLKEIENSEIIIGIYVEENDYKLNIIFLDSEFFLNDLESSEDLIILVKIKNENNLNQSNNKNNIRENIKLQNNIYCPKRKKNVYVLFRDQNIQNYLWYVQIFKMIAHEKANMSFFFEKSIEKALKFILKRPNDKVILITNIGLNYSGKRFIQIARKLLGFNIIILFFSNNPRHYEWVKEFPNCLFGNSIKIYKEYITNYNEEGLKKLKKEIEQLYNISLKDFTDDFLLYPNYKENDNSFFLNKNIKNEYLRHVNIYCESKRLYINMNREKNVICSEEGSPWDVTILDDEITFFSNEFYLDIKDDKESTIGNQYMIKWKFIKKDEKYYFIYPEKDNYNILSINDDNILKVNKNSPGNNEMFKLIDVEDLYDDTIDNISFLSQSNEAIINELDDPSNLSNRIVDLVEPISFSST